MPVEGAITDVEGVKVGHFTDPRRPTGCTVLLVEEGAVAGVDVRGGAPGTRETDLLAPLNLVSSVHAIVLAGGSGFGLSTADGVMRYLEERGFGFAAGTVRVPIVPAAILFDLGIGDASIRPDAQAGYAACLAARGRNEARVPQGSVGAGAGATVGKFLGASRAMKGGFGTAGVRHSSGLVVGAMVAVNAFGNVYDRSGRPVAGARDANGQVTDVEAWLRAGELHDPFGKPEGAGGNTTIGVVATNATLTKVEATKVAQMAHDGLARAIRPVHMPFDGDTIFAVATGKRPAESPFTGVIGALAAEAIAEAVVRAVVHATGLPGIPAYRDLHR